uniref:Glutamine amidotransferase like class 1 domain containing 1 n=1 Tax=Sinocyclocheilus anshuiensis TaxID=1608454 RepID=A0A671SCS5_9TELE
FNLAVYSSIKDTENVTARWVQEFSIKPYANPAKLKSVDGARYQALLIPDCPGALNDLAHSESWVISEYFHTLTVLIDFFPKLH